jgi:acetoin utilization deacetylase AcuC-like enzyme
MGAHHPECPARIHAIEDRLIAVGLFDLLLRREAPVASFEQLARVHDPVYIESLRELSPAAGKVDLDGDTVMNPHTFDAALRAAGSAVLGVDMVMSGQAANVFCAVRPPGHHAERARSMGFCLFNNVAVGAAHALAAHGLQRVAIADFDVHHGNGTEDIFREEPRVMLCSTFQHPFYPFSGAGSGNKHIINVPLPAGTSSAAFRSAVEEHWLPALDRFAPELILISAGFDAHRDDEMAMMRLDERDYAWVTQQLKTLATRHAQGRIVSLLEGGYALNALGRSVEAHIRVLADL